MKPIILASSSPARKLLLEKLQLPFSCQSPDIDETAHDHETAAELTSRLALEKARKIAKDHDNAIIIGCDQVASFNGTIFGKPHTHENALKALSLFAGHWVEFPLGFCVLDTTSGQQHISVETTSVLFRKLTQTQIDRYLHIDQPYQCAGSLSIENLGAAIVEDIKGDVNALIGLPLMKLVTVLGTFGVDVLPSQ